MTAEAEAAPERIAYRRLGPVPALDGLRGVAITLVVLSHLALLDSTGVTGFARLDDALRGGWMGVDLFFVLSGFLITALLLGEQAAHGSVRFRFFYGRRALRLLPALYVLLAIHAIYTLATNLPWQPEWLNIRAGLLYVTNWQLVHDQQSVVLGLLHLWSLAVEEQFYILFPVVLIGLLGLRRSARTVTIVLAGAIVLVALHRLRLFNIGVHPVYLFVRTDTRVDSLLVGALLGSLWVRGATPRRGVTVAAWLGAATFVVLLPRVSTLSPFNYKGGFTLIAVAAAAMTLGAVDGRWPVNRVLRWAPLRLLGRVSYGVYLWHVVLFVVIARYATGWSTTARIVTGLASTAAFAAASWLIIERAALRFKRRFERSTPAPAPV